MREWAMVKALQGKQYDFPMVDKWLKK